MPDRVAPVIPDKPIGSYATWYEAYEALVRWKHGADPASEARTGYTFTEIYEMYYRENMNPAADSAPFHRQGGCGGF